MKAIPLLTGMMSGSMGGVVASHNRGGQYFRQRVIPTNPATTRQNFARQVFGALVSTWTQDMTEAQRIAWSEWASQTPTTDVLGQALILTGQQAFIRANSAKQLAVAQSLLTGGPQKAAPTIYNTGSPVTAVYGSVDGNLGLPVIGIDSVTSALATKVDFESALDDDAQVLLFLSAPINTNRKFFGGPWQLAATTSAAEFVQTATFTNAAADMAQATALVADEVRGIRLIIVTNDGRVSVAYKAIATVVSQVAP